MSRSEHGADRDTDDIRSMAATDDSGQHGASHTVGSALTEQERETLRRAKICRAAAGCLTQSDLVSELPRLSGSDVRWVRRRTQIRPNAPTAALARAVRTILVRSDEKRTASILHDCLHYGVLSTNVASQLPIPEMAALLAGDIDGMISLGDQPIYQTLLDAEEFGTTRTARVSAWASMICIGHSADIMALAWLVADLPEEWPDAQRQALVNVWESVRFRTPDLPEKPMRFEDLVDVVIDADAEMHSDKFEDVDEPAILERPATAHASVTEPCGDVSCPATADALAAGGGAASELAELDMPSLQRVLDDLEQLRCHLEDEAAPALAEAVAAGRPPAEAHVVAVTVYTRQLTSVFNALARLTGTARPETLADARHAVEDALAATMEADQTAARLDRVRQVATLHGPEYVAAAVARVAALAAGVDDTTSPETLTGLEALCDIIDLAGGDPRRAVELGEVVTRNLPAAIPLLMFATTADAVTYTATPAGADFPGEPAAAGLIATQLAAVPGEVQATAKAHAAAAEPVDAESVAEPAGVMTPALYTDVPLAVTAEETTSPTPGRAVDETTPDDAVAGLDTDAEPDLENVLAGLDLTVPLPAARQPSHAAPEKTTEPRPSAGDTPDVDTSDASHVDMLYTDLLDHDQYALAYWLTTAESAPAAVSTAYRLAAHAAAIKTSTGSNAAAFTAAVTNLDAGTVRDMPDTQMLIYAAAVRAGLLSPSAGAAGPLRDIATSIPRYGKAVEELHDALLTAIYSGIYLTPCSINAVAEAAEADQVLQTLTAVAKELLARPRTILYAPATELWQTWMAPDGYLGRPLSIIAAGQMAPYAVALIRDRIANLRSRSTLEATIDRDTPRSTGKRSKRIESRAREKLLAWTGEVTELLSNWITAFENLTGPNADSWMNDPMTELRTRVVAVRDQALTELARRSETDVEARHAAHKAGLRLLTDALDLLVGTAAVPVGPEVSADRVLGGPLTGAANLPLTGAGEPAWPITVDDVLAAVRTAQAGSAGWRAAYEQRAARHDHVGTQLLIEHVRSTDAQLAAVLTDARDQAIATSTAKLDTVVTALDTRIDSDRLFSRVTVEEWTDLSTRVRAHQAGPRGTRRDYGAMFADLAAIEGDRAAAVGRRIAAARAALDTTGMASDDADRIQRCLDDGDLITAAEYIETLATDRKLPGPRDTVDHVRRFFPAFCDVFASRWSASNSTHPLLRDLQTALPAGRVPSDPALAGLLADAGIDLADLTRGKTIAERVDHWNKLAVSRTFDARIGNVKAVLEQIGFIFDKSTNPPVKRGQGGGRGSWLDLHGVRATAGKAIIPAFGTAMSPSGDTLRLLAVWKSPTPAELVEMLRSEPTDQSIVLLYFGSLDAAARRELARQFRSGRKLAPTAIIDDAAMAYLACQPTPGRDVTMAVTLPFTFSSPFTPDVPGVNVPQEMFYGRAEERDKVVDMMGPCVVYGGRQLGKSALLRAAEREFDDGSTRHAIYESIFHIGKSAPAEAVWTTLWPRLADKGIVPDTAPASDVAVTLTGHVADWVTARPSRQLLLLLDESDSFLDADANAAGGMFTQVVQFKLLMERTHRAVKIVFAGLHQTARFERLANHPLAHFGEPVCVGPLAPQAAYELLIRPLDALGFRFADTDQAARVLALTNNQPALIQLFAARLLRNLQGAPILDDAPPQTIAADDVEQVWADPTLRRQFRKRFDWTLDLDPHYKVIAYSVAQNAHAAGVDAAMTPGVLRAECEQWWPAGFAAEDIRAGEFRALLDESVDLGVLSVTERGYRLRTPNVLDLLGNRDEVDEVLERAASFEAPESFDGSLMRPVYGAGPTRAPLTAQQIADLLAPRRQVRLLVGSSALDVDRCLAVLEKENGNAATGNRRAVLVRATPGGLENKCRSMPLHSAGHHAVVLVDMKDATAEQALHVWRRARALIASHTGGTLGIVQVSGPAQAAAWPVAARESDTSSGLTELRRYDDTDLRLWFAQESLPFQDAASRAELLATTGGWPKLLDRLAQHLTGLDSGTVSDPLDDIRTWLGSNSQDLVAAAGVIADGSLQQAWEFLVRQMAGEATDLETFAEFLQLHADTGEPGSDQLTATGLAGNGYGGAEDVVEVLRALGVLLGDSKGQYRTEPVLAAATRRDE
ncbi:MAG: hypothetical protein QG671_527 [Actinomycetota bacterium]|nr:hypothetical protein [Actinomycetota bacterium]